MNKLYIDYPYKKINKAEIKETIEEKGFLYKSPKNTIVFLGNDKLESDKFKINSDSVEYIVRDGEIFYRVDEDYIEETIDYDHRLDIMQENLANALIRICIKKISDLKIESFKISSKENKIILDSNDISYKNISDIENLASYICFANLKVENEDGKISLDGYGSIDYQGPCLERTGELGLVKIINLNKNQENKIELSLVAGQRALDDYREKSKLISNLKNILFVENEEDIFSQVKNLKSKSNFNKVSTLDKKDSDEKTIRREDNIKENEKTLENKENIISKAETSEENLKNENKLENQEKKFEENENKEIHKDGHEQVNHIELIESFKNMSTLVGNNRYIYKIIKDMPLKEVKEISNKIMKEKNYIQIYGLENFDESQLIVTRSQNVNINLKEISNDISKKVPIKGFGNMYQVVANVKTQNLARAMEAFLINIKNKSEK